MLFYYVDLGLEVVFIKVNDDVDFIKILVGIMDNNVYFIYFGVGFVIFVDVVVEFGWFKVFIGDDEVGVVIMIYCY